MLNLYSKIIFTNFRVYSIILFGLILGYGLGSSLIGSIMGVSTLIELVNYAAAALTAGLGLYVLLLKQGCRFDLFEKDVNPSRLFWRKILIAITLVAVGSAIGEYRELRREQAQDMLTLTNQRALAAEKIAAKLKVISEAKAKAAAFEALSPSEKHKIITAEALAEKVKKDQARQQAAYDVEIMAKKRRATESKKEIINQIGLSQSLSRGGFDAILLADFVVTNSSSHTVKDIEITCTAKANSGTVVSNPSETIYSMFPANSSRTHREVSVGFIHSQAETFNCFISDLVKVD